MGKFRYVEKTENSGQRVVELKQNADGGLDVMVEDIEEPGDPWLVATFTPDGRLRLHPVGCCNDMEVDEEGYIKVYRD